MKCAHVVIGHNWLYVHTCFACELAMGYIEMKLLFQYASVLY